MDTKGHFLSHYDGVEIKLRSDAGGYMYAYRQN